MPRRKRINPLRFLDESDNAILIPSENNRIALGEWLVGILLTLLALYMHIVFLQNAGGFWRDEANSIHFALMPNLIDLWSALKFDSFPALHILIGRYWASIFGSTDTSFRVLGLIIGSLIIVALWYKSRELGGRAPLMSLLIMGTSPVMIRYLDSFRPYGLAMATTILSFAVVWRTVKNPKLVHLFISSLMLSLSVQAFYQSAIFVLAIGIGAVSVGMLRGGIMLALRLTVPFFIAGFSLLPYADNLREARDWYPVAMNPPETKSLLPGFLQSVQSPESWFMWVWLWFGLLAFAGVIRTLFNNRGERGRYAEPGLFLYCGITCLLSLGGFAVFLVYVTVFSPKIWHFVPVLLMTVISAEPFVRQVTFWKTKGSYLHLLVLVAIAFVTFAPSSRHLTTRMTSVDIISSIIEREAGPEDLVVLNPWWLGISFNRYYRGSTPWMTFPSLQDNAIHRFDLLKERMKHPESIYEDMARISSTLERGGKIWVIGDVYIVSPEQVVKPLPPAPLWWAGWSSDPYVINWNKHLLYYLVVHSRRADIVPVPTDRIVSDFESPIVAVVQGWVP